MVSIEDREVVCTSGKTHHPIVAFTGKDVGRPAAPTLLRDRKRPYPRAPGGANPAKAYIQTINVPIDHNVVIDTVAATSGSSQ